MQAKRLARNNVVLLICLLALLFLFPFFRTKAFLVRDLLHTAIFFGCIFSLDFSPRALKILLPLGAITAATTWVEHFFRNQATDLVDSTATFLFLVAIVVLMIRHIAKSRHVTPAIILSSINGYLLLGVLGGALLAIAGAVDQIYFASQTAGIVFSGIDAPRGFDYLYFSFVTLTTLGYGDITPVAHLSRSTAILLAITGQLYLTILVAMLVGKFLSRPEENPRED
jgi:uncharacterized membrane protein